MRYQCDWEELVCQLYIALPMHTFIKVMKIIQEVEEIPK